jgi:hypothetical protein
MMAVFGVAKRSPRPITEAACWSHGRRKFCVLADLTTAPGKKHGAPLAVEAVRRIDAIFAIEREINGLPAEQRLAVRTTRIAPLVSELEGWMRSERARLSRHADVAKAMDYMLKRWAAFTRFLSDGRICLTNNAAERALRGIAIGRKNWLFAGSDCGGERAASMIPDRHRQAQQHRSAGLARRRAAPHCRPPRPPLLPWNWHALTAKHAAAAQNPSRYCCAFTAPAPADYTPSGRGRMLTDFALSRQLRCDYHFYWPAAKGAN